MPQGEGGGVLETDSPPPRGRGLGYIWFSLHFVHLVAYKN